MYQGQDTSTPCSLATPSTAQTRCHFVQACRTLQGIEMRIQSLLLAVLACLYSHQKAHSHISPLHGRQRGINTPNRRPMATTTQSHHLRAARTAATIPRASTATRRMSRKEGRRKRDPFDGSLFADFQFCTQAQRFRTHTRAAHISGNSGMSA